MGVSFDPEHFYVDTGYHDPRDPREDSFILEDEEREMEAREILRERGRRASKGEVTYWTTLGQWGLADEDFDLK